MVIDRFDDVKNGGIQSTRRFVQYLRINHNVTVLAAGESQEGLAQVPGFYVPFMKEAMIKNGMVFARPIEDTIRQVVKDADIVHIQFPFYLGWTTARIAKEMGKPLVCSYHVQPENILLNMGIRSRRMVRLLHRFFMKKFYNLADVVISPSQLGKDELTCNGLTSECFVLSNGYMPEFSMETSHQSAQDREKPFVILNVGRLSREKNQELLIEAVDKSLYRENIHLVLVGDGTEKNRLQEKIKILPHATLTGQVNREELIQWYQDAHLYIHPSLVELESLTVLEAMAAGLPIMVSNSPTSAAKQFVLDDDFIFQFDDSSDLASRIDYVLDNPDLLAQTAESCHRLAQQFTIAQSVARLERIYQFCIDGGPVDFPGEVEQVREEIENPVL